MGFFQRIFGTVSSFFQFGGPSGPGFNDNVGVIEAKNSTNSAFVIVRGADPVGPNDFVTLESATAIVGPFAAPATNIFGSGGSGVRRFEWSEHKRDPHEPFNRPQHHAGGERELPCEQRVPRDVVRVRDRQRLDHDRPDRYRRVRLPAEQLSRKFFSFRMISKEQIG